MPLGLEKEKETHNACLGYIRTATNPFRSTCVNVGGVVCTCSGTAFCRKQ